MKNQTLKIAVSSQKGGVGKTTLTVLIASYLHYVVGRKVCVFDCDFPQHSIKELRDRDIDHVMSDAHLKELANRQFQKLEKTAYPIVETSPNDALKELNRVLTADDEQYDYLFFDLPGTLNTSGVVTTLAAMDFLVVPIIADRIVMESSLQFAATLRDNIIAASKGNIKEILLVWNMVDRREKSNLYQLYEQIITELGFESLETWLPDSKKFRKETLSETKGIFRSTLFPIDKNLERGSRIADLVFELEQIFDR